MHYKFMQEKKKIIFSLFFFLNLVVNSDEKKLFLIGDLKRES